MRIRNLKNLALLLLLTVVNVRILQAQSGTSSALAGTISDATGAVVPNATVKAMDVSTGATRTARSNADGRFLFAQVNPGTYRIAVQAEGFGAAESQPATVAVGQTIAVNFTLSPAATSQTVEVTTHTGLLSLDNPNTSTTLEAKAIEKLPNPGQDLTYLAQFAQGALMNTAGSSNDAKAPGGYGNVEFNGLPATSNGYILDGFDSNDPWLGLNIGLSTNLVIGLDAVQEATINTNSFSVDEGRYAVAQVNYFTKSGTNAFHGDAQTVPIRALRGDSHCTADRVPDYPANAGIPAVCIGATRNRRNGPSHWRGSSGGACGDPLLPEDVLSASRIGRLPGADCRLPARHKRQWLRKPAPGFAE